MDGPEVARIARTIRQDMGHLHAGYAEDSFRKQVPRTDGGAVHFLPKPFPLQELAAKVKDVMSALDQLPARAAFKHERSSLASIAPVLCKNGQLAPELVECPLSRNSVMLTWRRERRRTKRTLAEQEQTGNSA